MIVLTEADAPAEEIEPFHPSNVVVVDQVLVLNVKQSAQAVAVELAVPNPLGAYVNELLNENPLGL
jgi:hypothetical protein